MNRTKVSEQLPNLSKKQSSRRAIFLPFMIFFSVLIQQSADKVLYLCHEQHDNTDKGSTAR